MFRYTLPSQSRVFSETRLHSLPAELVELPDLRPLIWHIWIFIFLVVASVIFRVFQFYSIREYRPPQGGARRRESNERSLNENHAPEHMADGSPEFYEWLRRRNRRQRLNNPF